jgi:hypothetical protein
MLLQMSKAVDCLVGRRTVARRYPPERHVDALKPFEPFAAAPHDGRMGAPIDVGSQRGQIGPHREIGVDLGELESGVGPITAQGLRDRRALGQVLLNETRTEMDINLDEGRVANAAEAMDLPGLDDKNVTSTGLEFLAIDGPQAPAFPDELDFIVRVTMWSWARPGRALRRKTETLTSPFSAPTKW